jgi:Niemann-Pick C2 protein
VHLSFVKFRKFKQCIRFAGKTGAVPKAVRIEGCDKPPCELYRGADITMEVDFEAVTSTKTLKPQVFATAVGITIPYELPSHLAEACKYLANEKNCPLTPGHEYTYKLTMPVDKNYPAIPVSLEFSLQDEHGTPEFCFQVRCTVV